MQFVKTKIKTLGKLVCWLLLYTFFQQCCFANPAGNAFDGAEVQKNSFSRSAPLPVWALPLAPIPETVRTDPVVVRLSESQVQLGAETGMLMNRAIQVNERNALSKIGQYSIVYYPIYQKLKLHKIALLRAGHVIDKMDSVNIRQLQRETSMESGMYGGATTVELLLDDVRIGDTLWLTYTVTGQNPVFDKKWHSDFSWDQDEPIELRRITVTYPNTRKVVWDQVGDFKKEPIPSRVDELPGQHRMQFEERGIDAVDFETATPADYVPIRLLEFSEFSDWHGVAKWADELFPKVKSSPLLAGLIKDFSREDTPEKKAAAALHWVQNEVRYFSVSIGENSHRPQPPDVVIKKRYGDCKDKSYLLVSILGQMGIKAYPVLIAAHAPKIPTKVLPSPQWFDHAIVRVDINGRQYFVDPTITGQVSPLENLPTAMPGAAGLLVDSATTGLIDLPERADVGPNYEHNENIVITRIDGDVALDMNDTYSGFYSDFARSHFTDLSETELTREILSYYEKQYPGVTISGKPELQDDKEKNQFHVHAYFNLPKPVEHENQIYKINFDSQILKGTLKIPDKLVRNFPFQIGSGKHFSRYRLTINWPENVHINFPSSSQNIDNSYFNLHDDTQTQDSQISYVMDFQIKQDIVPAEDMAVLHAQTKLLDKYANTSFHIPENLVSETKTWVQPFRSLNSSKPVYPNTSQNSLVAQPAVTDEQKLNQFQTEQGHIFYFGKGVPVDYAKALDWYTKAAAGGNQFAQFNLGIMYEKGQGIEQDFAKAVALYLQAAEQGNAAAENNLGGMYERGRGVPKDLVKAVEWYREAAEHGDIQGQANLGNMYQNGTGVPIDYVQAREWYLKAAASGNSDAQNNLGNLYNDGSGVPQDHAQAAELYRESADQGNAIGQSNLGNAYRDGKGVSADLAKAFDLYSKSAAKGYERGQTNLASLYDSGTFVKRDYDLAMKWYRAAAEQGYPNAQNALGVMYQLGHGVEKDNVQARDWYKKAAGQGLADAQKNLGELYRSDGKNPEDLREALEWFQKAAMQGNTNAMVSLGIMYHLGQSVAKNYVVAYALYDKANTDNTAEGKIALENRDKVAKLMFQSDIDAAQNLSREMGMPGNLLNAIDASVNKRETMNAEEAVSLIGHENAENIKADDFFRLWKRSSLSVLDNSVFTRSEQQTMLAQISIKMLGSNPGQCHDQFEMVSFLNSRQINPGAEIKNRSELWTLRGCKSVKKFVVFETAGKVLYTPYEFDD
jgi:TPR repeat protein/transglutaminase-like putative cysteine protease